MKSLKYSPIAFDAKSLTQDGSFEGYASTFGNVDQGMDRVMPGAFAQSLLARPANAIKMLWQHDPAQPIGVWSEAYEDSKGLRVKGTILRDVQKGAEVLQLIKAGAIDALSIGFKTVDADMTPKGVRQLKAVELYEISFVTFPMNDLAVGALKDFNPREAEKRLREAGFSRGEAVKAVACFRDVLRDAEPCAILPREAADLAHDPEISKMMRELIATMQ